MHLVFTEDDFEVAEVLLTLKTSHHETAAARGFTLSWAMRKSRSLRRRRRSPPSISRKADVAASPAVGARQKSHSKKLAPNGHSLKKKRDTLLKMMDELTSENKFLRMEKENFHCTLLKLKTENLQLKLKAERHHMSSPEGKFLQKLPGGDNVNGVDRPSEAKTHSQPLIIHPTVHIQSRTEGLFMHPYNQSLPLQSQPRNKTYHDDDVDIYQSSDMNIANSTAGALARLRRKEIYKSKSPPKNSLTYASSQNLIFVARYI